MEMTKVKKKEKNLLKLSSILSQMLIDPDLPFPDVVSFNILIDALGKHGYLSAMNEYFCMMIEYGIRPTVITFTSMLDAYINHKYIEEAKRIIDLMDIMGIEWNDFTYSSAQKLKRFIM